MHYHLHINLTKNLTTKAKYFLLYFIIVLFAASCHTPMKKKNLFDANQLSYSLSPDKVIRIMGEKPDSAFNNTIMGKERYILLYFNKDSTEFRFDKNKLSEVIVNKPEFPFSAQSIAEFGLVFHEPSQIDTTAFIKWGHVYRNYEVINFYLVGSRRDPGSLHYKIYFKTEI
jgi:hypothetical protein